MMFEYLNGLQNSVSAYLFSKWFPAQVVRAVTLVGFSQEGVEGFGGAVNCGGVSRDGECGNVD